MMCGKYKNNNFNKIIEIDFISPEGDFFLLGIFTAAYFRIP